MRTRLLDLGVVVTLLVAGEVELLLLDVRPLWAAAAATATQCVALYWRRRAAPLVAVVVFGMLFAEAAAGVSLHEPTTPILIAFVAAYAAGRYSELPIAIATMAYSILVGWASISLAWHRGDDYTASDYPWVAFVFAAPWVAGVIMRRRSEYTELLEDRAERLAREGEMRARVAAADERARIARELHDVIAHSVSVMVVQAGGAEQVLRTDPERALAPIRAVQETGRQALAEMARLLGMLREDGEEVGLEPQPGLADLDALVEQTRVAGLPVELSLDGKPRQLPLGVDLSAYRIVQEALTNARKHSTGGRAEVFVHYGEDAVDVEVTSDGQPTGNGEGGGHGLVGMRERAALFGGALEAGLVDGGFRVHARLPLEAAQ
jgi:signal transduction histidine kinase